MQLLKGQNAIGNQGAQIDLPHLICGQRRLEARRLRRRGHQPPHTVETSLRAVEIDLIGSERVPRLGQVDRRSDCHDFVLELVSQEPCEVLAPREPFLTHGAHTLQQASRMRFFFLQPASPLEVRFRHFEAKLLGDEHDSHRADHEVLTKLRVANHHQMPLHV